MDAPGTLDRLIGQLQDARQRTLTLFGLLADEELLGPKLRIVNPPLWEVGHVGWFHEYWVLRHGRSNSPRMVGCDALYDSAKVHHGTRWDLDLPSRAATLDYLADIQRTIIDGATDSDRYWLTLVMLHEDMHAEAFTYTRQTHGHTAPPPIVDGVESPTAGPLAGDADIPGGTFMLGAAKDEPFVFDNEKWAHEVEVQPFSIARAAVTQAEFASFVDDGGYAERRFWSDDGWRWRERDGATHPVYWKRDGQAWLRRHFDTWVALEPHRPVIHVNWYEADAFCRWAGRRLPSEIEWEVAAAGMPEAGKLSRDKRRFPWGDSLSDAQPANIDGRHMHCVDVGAYPESDSAFGCRQMIGNVWEWTSTDFGPYPGFVRDPYKEYSEPWFGDHKVLRGGCFATRARLVRNTWRNFYTPDRRDVWSGFRTCAQR